jgi:2-methylisocitrate lyase-like PEP mutase family enzyme
VLYAPALPGLEAIRTVCAAVAPRPVNVLAGGRQSGFTVANLAAAGVRRISLGSALSRAALGALLRAAREILDAGTFTFGDEAASFAELNRFMAGP